MKIESRFSYEFSVLIATVRGVFQLKSALKILKMHHKKFYETLVLKISRGNLIIEVIIVLPRLKFKHEVVFCYL